MTIDLGKSYLQSKEREDVMKKCEGVIANQQPTPRVNYSNFSNLFTRVSYTTNFFWQVGMHTHDSHMIHTHTHDSRMCTI